MKFLKKTAAGFFAGMLFVLAALAGPVCAATVQGFSTSTPAFTVTNNDTGQAFNVDPANSLADSPVIITSDGMSVYIEVPDGYAYNLSTPGGFAEPLTVLTTAGVDQVSAGPLTSLDFNTVTGEVATAGASGSSQRFTPQATTSGLTGAIRGYAVTSASGAPFLLTPKTGGIRLTGDELAGTTVEGFGEDGVPQATYTVPEGLPTVSLLADGNTPALTEVDAAVLDGNTLPAESGADNPYDLDEDDSFSDYESEEEDVYPDGDDGSYGYEDDEEEEYTYDDGDSSASTTDVMAGFSQALVIISGVVLALALAGWVLQGIGLSKIAKNRGIGHRWFAWVPVLSNYLLGEIIGGTLWGIPMIPAVLAGLPLLASVLGGAVSIFAPQAGMIVSWAIILVVTILYYGASYKLYKMQSPNWAVVWLIVTIFLPLIGGPLADFCVRNGGGDGPAPEKKKKKDGEEPEAQAPADGAWGSPVRTGPSDPWGETGAGNPDDPWNTGAQSAASADGWGQAPSREPDNAGAPGQAADGGFQTGQSWGNPAPEEPSSGQGGLWDDPGLPPDPKDPWNSAPQDGGDDPWGNMQ